MILVCFICKTILSSINGTIRHLRIIHGLFDNPKLHVKCCLQDCPLTYKTFSGLRKHMLLHLKEHDKEQSYASLNTDINENNRNQTNRNQSSCESYDNNSTDDVNLETVLKESNENVTDDIIDIENAFQIFFSQLMATTIPQTTLQVIVDSTSDLLDNIFDTVLLNSTTSHIQSTKKTVKTELTKYSTVYKRNKIFNSSNTVVPKEKHLGMRNENVYDTSLNICIEKNLPRTFQYIPILESLKNIISHNTNIFKNHYLLTSHSHNNNNNLIVNGSVLDNNILYKEKKYFLQLQLFYDDFETVNPLGTKTGCHKMGAIYFTIHNMPSLFNSNLKHIHLLALFYTADLKSSNSLSEPITLNDILLPIINDIKLLENDGIRVDGFEEPIFGTVTSLSHDNLAANSLHGMVESFQSNFFCRFCLCHKEVIQTLYSERSEDCVLRTSAQYENACESITLEKHIFGIKRRSILNDLKYFKLFDTGSVDIMHDILEGSVQYELKLFLNYLVNEKIITLTEINERIHAYNYGYLNRSSKPSSILLDKNSNSIGQKAAQAWTLVRYLPMIIDDLVTSHNVMVKYNVILTLLQIMSIVFAPRISTEMVVLLEKLVETHLRIFKNAFNSNLIPKQHFLIHYPRIIRLMGPLINLWCMRYEGKHSVLKHLALKCRNYKNIAKTLATKIQQMSFFSHSYMYCTDYEFGPTTICRFDKYVHKQLIVQNIEEFLEETQISIVKWVKYGYLYKTKFVVCTGIATNGLPLFEEILEIIVIEKRVFFVTQKMICHEFSKELHAYKLGQNTYSEPPKLNVIDINFLIYKEPYDKHQPYSSSNFYVVPKHMFTF